MARKLLIMAALISLVLLAQAPVSLAATYEIGQLGDNSNWTWKHGYSSGHPWDQMTEFIAGAPMYDSSQADSLFKLGFFASGEAYQPFYNDQEGTHTDSTFTVSFNSTTASPNFFINIPSVPSIMSNDTTFTYNATYSDQGQGIYTILSGTIAGNGTNISDGKDFHFTIQLVDSLGDHKNVGYIESLTLEYPYIASPAPAPIPGAMWLLGTGLLGLACLRPRLKK